MNERKRKVMDWAQRQIEAHLKLAVELESWALEQKSEPHMKAAERHLKMALVLDRWERD